MFFIVTKIWQINPILFVTSGELRRAATVMLLEAFAEISGAAESRKLGYLGYGMAAFIEQFGGSTRRCAD